MIGASQGGRYNNLGIEIWTPGIQNIDRIINMTSYFPNNCKIERSDQNDEKMCDKANTINISVNKQTQMTFAGCDIGDLMMQQSMRPSLL